MQNKRLKEIEAKLSEKVSINQQPDYNFLVRECLEAHRIQYNYELVSTREADFYKGSRAGRKTVKTIMRHIQESGIHLSRDDFDSKRVPDISLYKSNPYDFIRIIAAIILERENKEATLKFNVILRSPIDYRHPELDEKTGQLLRKARYVSHQDLVDASASDLLLIPNFAQKNLDAVQRYVKAQALDMFDPSPHGYLQSQGRLTETGTLLKEDSQGNRFEPRIHTLNANKADLHRVGKKPLPTAWYAPYVPACYKGALKKAFINAMIDEPELRKRLENSVPRILTSVAYDPDVFESKKPTKYTNLLTDYFLTAHQRDAFSEAKLNAVGHALQEVAHEQITQQLQADIGGYFKIIPWSPKL